MWYNSRCIADQKAGVNDLGFSEQKKGFVLRYLRQFLWIIGFTLVGEVLHAALPLPVPAAVWGLVLLFIALESGKLKLSSVQDCGQFMLGLMPVLFIAPSVGLMDSWSMLASVWPAVLAIIVLSTVVVFAVSGVVTQTLMDFVSARENAGQPMVGQAEEVSDD